MTQKNTITAHPAKYSYIHVLTVAWCPLRGPKRAVKAKSTDTIRVWFVPVLARGKLHLELLPADFPGETERGAEILVAKVRADGRTGGQMDGRTDGRGPALDLCGAAPL